MWEKLEMYAVSLHPKTQELFGVYVKILKIHYKLNHKIKDWNNLQYKSCAAVKLKVNRRQYGEWIKEGDTKNIGRVEWHSIELRMQEQR